MEGMRPARKRSFDDLRSRMEASGTSSSGKDKNVYDHPDKTDEVISVEKKEYLSSADRKEHLRQFVLVRILHLLYPEAVPDATGIASRDGVMMREKIGGKHLSRSRHLLNHFWGIAGEKGREEFERKMVQLGINIDLWPRNFKREDGNVYYLDTFVIREPLLYVAEQLEKEITAKFSDTPKVKGKALHLLRRLRSLA